jgi:hypothetical protein
MKAAIMPTELPVQITLNASPDHGPAVLISPLARRRYRSLFFDSSPEDKQYQAGS